MDFYFHFLDLNVAQYVLYVSKKGADMIVLSPLLQSQDI